MAPLQSGIVTFLFTDIEGSTRLWETDLRAMSAALVRHDELLRSAIEAAGGQVFNTAGDAFCAVFPLPADAIAAAIAAQQALADQRSGSGTALRVRMAIHAGHAEMRDGDYFGPPLNRVARLLSTGHGSQILVSRSASDLARDHLPAGVSLRDLGEHALKDLQQPERVFQVLAPGLVDDFPPLRTAEQLLRNVPRPTTALIGREAEIATVRRLFGLAPSSNGDQQTARILTLTGPGGAGKTRLALHLATELGVAFSDGAAFVPLASLSDPAHVPTAIANALELGDPGAMPMRDFVLQQLQQQHLLLILDNLEQVMGAADLVADLLLHCPRIAVVATSRQRLNLRGEQEVPIPPLALPQLRRQKVLATSLASDPNTPTIDEIRASEAVRLFVERARLVQPTFDVTPENADAIVEICLRLDGLPLAIELAAARARHLSPQALLARFDRRLDVLSRGQRDLPARQQTMRDTIAWSYDLLDAAEQRLFAGLSIFVGGATLEACEEIVEVPGIDLLEVLESLADKSLIRFVLDEESRVSMLETIRDFARERLEASGDLSSVALRHADYFLRLAEETEPLLEGREQTRTLDRLDRDQGNLRSAIIWWRDQGETERALRMSGALWRFWWLRGDMEDGRTLLEGLLLQSASVLASVRAKALNGAGVLAESQGESEQSARFHEESLAISRALGDLRGVAWSLNNLGVVAINSGDLERAEMLLQENLAVAEATGDTASIALALMDLGQVAHHLADHDLAASFFTRSLEHFRKLGNESHMARALNNLGDVAFRRGDYQRAQALLAESLTLHRRVGDRLGIASTMNNLASLANTQGDLDTAMGLYLEAYSLAIEGRNRLYAGIALENLAAITQYRNDSRLAWERYREALLLFRSVGDFQGIVSCLIGLATAAIGLGRTEEGTTMLAAASSLAEAQLQDPCLLPGFEAARVSLSEGLSEAEFQVAWQAGNLGSFDELMASLERRFLLLGV